MAKETERKFLVNDTSYKGLAVKAYEIAQGYLSVDADRTVRIRIKGNKAYITVKTRNVGLTRNEWEYEIPVDDAREMLSACVGIVITKTRYIVPATNGLYWEIDEFHGHHGGLILAEIELPCDDFSIEIPSFIGKEVSDNPAYYNSSLSKA